MAHYITDLPDALRALESIVDDMIEKETQDLLDKVSELEEEIQELEAENESLREFKAMYEGLCK